METTIVVHGVGGAKPGVVAAEVAANPGIVSGRQGNAGSRGHSFVEIVDDAGERSVLEVNWSDVRRPTEQALSVFRFLVDVLTSMLDVAAGPRRPMATIYRAALLTVTPGAMLFVVATAVGFVVPDDNIRRLTLALLAIAGAAGAIFLRRFGRYADLFWVWVTGVTVVGATTFWCPLPEASALLHLSRSARGWGFAGVMLALDLAAVEALVRTWRKPAAVRLAGLAFLFAPYVVVNGLATWATFLAFAWFARFPGNFPMLLQLSTPRGLEKIELATTIVIGGLALLILVAPLVLYRLGSFSPASIGNRWGTGARDGLLVVLAVAPLALLLLQIAVFYIGSTSAPADCVKSPSGCILDVYGRSVLRTLPFAGWMVGPFAVALRMIGDVLFYIQPNAKHPAAIGEECRNRLRAPLAYATRKPTDRVVVLAHSQGSVIASDLRQRGELQCPLLLTMGSPISSIYSRFLGIDLTSGQNSAIPWVNAFRDGDYIGGAIASESVENRTIGPGGHTEYWTDSDWTGRVAPFLRSKGTRKRGMGFSWHAGSGHGHSAQS